MGSKLRPKSKRVSLHKKYKIQRRVKEHNRKARKEAKNPLKSHKKLKKDPGIPNLWPLKEEFIQKLQNQKAKLEEEKERQREQRLEQVNKKRSLEKMAAEASKRSEEFDEKHENDEEEENQASMFNIRDNSKRAYFREFKKILEIADVILEVLDARDPLGSRCKEIEQKILQKDPNKKIILILNKIDLIPKDNVEHWLKYLRNEYPTVAFKCTTQEQRKNLNQSSVSTDFASKNLLQSSECLGADLLIQLLKNYCRSLNIKTNISVGIIGYPNVGKSSLINSLKRTKAVGVGATPGFTKTTQEIYLDKHVKLIDCPGIIFSNKATDTDIILRNAVKIEQIPDPIEPVEVILKRCKKDQLIKIYKIPQYANINEFLIHIAQKRGKLGKGGVADQLAAARTVLQDWNGGKIPFYTVPPEVKNVHVAAQIVSSWGQAFDIENLMDQEKTILSSLPSNSDGFMSMAPGTSSVDVEYLNEHAMEDAEVDQDLNKEFDNMEDNESVATEIPDVSSFKVTKKAKKEEEDPLNPQVNKNRKKDQKKLKKQQKKQTKKISRRYG